MKMMKRRPRRLPVNTGPCVFCKNKTEPDYKDAEGLKPFMTDRGRLMARLQTALCAKHQRRVTKAVKRARHLALLSFTSYTG